MEPGRQGSYLWQWGRRGKGKGGGEGRWDGAAGEEGEGGGGEEEGEWDIVGFGGVWRGRFDQLANEA